MENGDSIMLGTIGAGVAILTLIWGMYTYYKPRTVEQQPEPKYREPRLSECLPANRVNDAIVFLDWIQKNPSGYVQTYPSFVALRPYLTILQSDGFIEESRVSNLDGAVYHLTSQGQKALIAAGVKLA
jgi:hypothetical protein